MSTLRLGFLNRTGLDRSTVRRDTACGSGSARNHRQKYTLRFVLPCVLRLALPAVATAETRALLVGVSAYQHLPEALHLFAPRNDVVEIGELLIRRGVKKRNIRILTDPGKAP